ncbi:MAG: hypothetical protein EXX96DRAFT_486721 [Benjaminiella poitrasii]|nr:MAG: hypothetical protein EXX96DRAFT_486721 [Benjaminiella poitrasii]
MWQSEQHHLDDDDQVHQHHHHHSSNSSINNEDNDDDEVDADDDDDDASSISSPSIPDENINFDLVYALHTFVATVEGQASVVKGDALILMEDTNIYWWLVEVLKTREVGYIPAENIETPYERLARLNKHRNVEITSPSIHDVAPLPAHSQQTSNGRRVTIGDESKQEVFHYEVESDIEETMIDEFILEEEEEDDVDDDENEERQEQENKIQEEERITEEAMHITGINDLTHHQQQQVEIALMTEPSTTAMALRVFAGNIGQGPLFHTFIITQHTTADELIKTAVERFEIVSKDATIEHYLAVQGMDGDEYVLSVQDKPFSIFRTLTDSLTTPMPSLSHIRRISQQSISSLTRPRSSSFNEPTSFDEDSVIRFYLHRRIKRVHERESLIYIKVSLFNVQSKQHSSLVKTVDRMDKVIAVTRESVIGAVVNLALEKFHVPDVVKKKKLVKEKKKKTQSLYIEIETELNPYQLMSDVLIDQQSSSPNHVGPITSELLFILRKATAQKKKSQKERHMKSMATTTTVVDAAHDPTKQQQQHSPSSSSSSSFPNNNKQNSSSSYSSNSRRPSSSQTSSSSLLEQQEVMKPEKKKESTTTTSLKQQLKRWVGWGSSSSSSSSSSKANKQETTVTPATMPLPPPPPPPPVHRIPTEDNHQDQDPSAAAMAVQAVVEAAHSQRLSTVSSISSDSSSSTTSVTTQEIAAAAAGLLTLEKDSHDDDDESEDATTSVEQMKVEETLTTSQPPRDISNVDIQAQYAMWMTSQQEPQDGTSSVFKKPLPPPVVQTKQQPALVHKSSLPALTTACTTPSIASTLTQRAFEEPNVTTTTVGNNTNDVDDLYILVAHGVDFLTAREKTKWEEDGGGYDFHPWNRPQSSFAIRSQQQHPHHQQQQQQEAKPMSPPLTPLHPQEDVTPQQQQVEMIAKRVLGAKVETHQQKHESLDDEVKYTL